MFEDRTREWAEQQLGLVAKFNVREMGGSTDEWRALRRSGRWDVLSPRVLRVKGSPSTDEQRVLAAVLDASPGAFLHGPSALAWLGTRGFSLADLKVARPRAIQRPTPCLAELHFLRAVRAYDVIVARGVPTETPLRAVWSEAERFSSPSMFEVGLWRVGRLLDDAHKANLVTWSGLHEMVNDIQQRGRGGTALMRELARARPPGSSPTESRQEDRLEKLLADSGARPLRRQIHVGGQEPIGRVDFCDDELPLVVEVNSLIHHTTPSDRAADELRYRRLSEAGFLVAVVWEDDLWASQARIPAFVATARRAASRGERVVLHSQSCPWPR